LNSTGLYFGELAPGETSDVFSVGLTNEGDETIAIYCNVTDDGGAVFVPGVQIDDSGWYKFAATLESKDTEDMSIVLHVPNDLSSGRYTGNITFWAGVPTENVAPPSDWSTFQGDNHHTGVTSEKAPISSTTLEWSAFSSSSGMAGFDVTPIVADNTLYTIDNKGTVIAYNASTGSILWQRSDLVLNSGMGFQLSTPTYNDGVLYVSLIMGSGKGVGVFALSASEGQTIWSIPQLVGGYSQPNTPLVYDEGRLYLGNWLSSSTPGMYFCINAATGTMMWQRECSSAASYYWAGAAVIGDYLVYGDEAGNLTSVNKQTGTTGQEISVSDIFGIPSGKIRSTVSYSDDSGLVLFTIQSGFCCAIGFDPSTGTFDAQNKWSASIGFSTSTPAIYGGKVYVGTGEFTPSRGSNILCLDENSGSVLWNFTADGGVQSSPVISTYYDDGDGEVYIYFTTNLLAGSVYCLNGDGSVMWKYTPQEEQQQYLLQGVAIYDGTVYFGNDAGYFFALGGP
jgi:outer membrane protein assembly factor BamB